MSNEVDLKGNPLWMCKFPCNIFETLSCGKPEESFKTLQRCDETFPENSADDLKVRVSLQGKRKDEPVERDRAFPDKSENSKGNFSGAREMPPICNIHVGRDKKLEKSLNLESPQGNLGRTSQDGGDMCMVQSQNYPEKNTNNSSPNAEPTVYKCPHCGKVMRKKASFLAHIELHVKSPVNYKFLRCDLCKKVFNNRKKFSKHQKRCVDMKKKNIWFSQDIVKNLNQNAEVNSQGDLNAQSIHSTFEVQVDGARNRQFSVVHNEIFPDSKSENSVNQNLAVYIHDLVDQSSGIHSKQIVQNHDDNTADSNSRSNAYEKQSSDCVSYADRVLSETHTKTFIYDSDLSCLVNKHSSMNGCAVDDYSLECDLEDYIESHYIYKGTGKNIKPPSHSFKHSKIQEGLKIRETREVCGSNEDKLCCVKVSCISPKEKENIYVRDLCLSKDVSNVKKGKSRRTLDVQSSELAVGKGDELCSAKSPLNTSDKCSLGKNLNCDENVKLLSTSRKCTNVWSECRKRIEPILKQFSEAEKCGSNKSESSKESCSANSSTHKRISEEKNVRILTTHKNNAETLFRNSQDNVKKIDGDKQNISHSDFKSDTCISNCVIYHNDSPVRTEVASKNVVNSILKVSDDNENLSLKSNLINEIKNENYDTISPVVLEEQYQLKKCFVKLSRVCVQEPGNLLKTDVESIINKKADGEFRNKRKIHCIEPTTNSINKDSIVHDSRNKSVKISRLVSKLECDKKKKPKPCVNVFKGECSWCHKIFLDQHSYSLHLITHSTGYKCPNCTATFEFRLQLQSHCLQCPEDYFCKLQAAAAAAAKAKIKEKAKEKAKAKAEAEAKAGKGAGEEAKSEKQMHHSI